MPPVISLLATGRPFYFLNKSVKKNSSDFNNFRHTHPEELIPENYDIAHRTYKLLSHYLEKCIKWFFYKIEQKFLQLSYMYYL